jgi:predicted transcriptional regulator
LRHKTKIAPQLNPERERSRGMTETLRAVAKFVRNYGFWPRQIELARTMRATSYAVGWYLRALTEEGLLERKRPYRRGIYGITAAGWTMLGVLPVAPYVPRPTVGTQRAALTTAVARRVVRALAGRGGLDE